MIEITVKRSSFEPEKHRFAALPIRIGRGEDNDLVIDSPGSSRYHAQVTQEGESVKIGDLGSTNGLLHQSRVVRDLVLADGAEVGIGEHQLIFNLSVASSAERTVRLDYTKLAAASDKAAQETSPILYLVWRQGNKELSLKLVVGTEYVIGRSPSSDVVLEDEETSTRHAMVTAHGNRFTIRDLESSNGTRVNDDVVVEAPLSPGDQIAIGQTVLRVTDEILHLADQANLLERTRSPEVADVQEALRRSEELVRNGKDRSRDLTVGLGAAAVVAVAAVAFFVGRGLEEPPQTLAPENPSVASAVGGTPASGGETRVQVAPVVADELVFDVSGSGSVRAHRTATISSEVASRVVEMSVAEGAGVTKGVLLVRLNDRDIQNEIKTAKASVNPEQVDLAKTDYERKQRLFNEGAVVRSVFEQAKNHYHYLSLDSAWRTTQARISQLREQLSKTSIRAPISGVVAKTFVNPGELVAPGVPVLSLENMEAVVVTVDLADRDFVGVQLGQSVEATTDAFPGRVFRGEVGRLGSAANPVTRTFEVEARLENADFSLRSGMIVWLRIIQGQDKGLVIPVEALLDDATESAVVFVVRGGVAHRVEVRLGRRLDRTVQVTEGLAQGDEVVVYGHEQLVEGQAVRTYREQ